MKYIIHNYKGVNDNDFIVEQADSKAIKAIFNELKRIGIVEIEESMLPMHVETCDITILSV